MNTKDLTSWLLLADNYYLSARLNFLHGLFPAAHQNSAIAIEFYLKLLLQIKGLDHKITHNLRKGFKLLNINLDSILDEFIKEIQDNNTRNRYPDNKDVDKIKTWEERLNPLDAIIYQLRNQIIDSGCTNKSGIFDMLAYIKIHKCLNDGLSEYFGSCNLKEVFYRHNLVAGKFKFI